MHYITAGLIAIGRLAEQTHGTIGAAQQFHALRLDHGARIGRCHTQQESQRHPTAQHDASQALEHGEQCELHGQDSSLKKQKPRK
jgi:hypothetical protein